MKSDRIRTPLARDVELSAYNNSDETDDRTVLPSRLSPGSDCCIWATVV